MTLTNSIKKVGKGIGKGLVAIGKKIGSILPGLIGSIVSFFFQSNWETHFLSVLEHTWPIILAVVAFLMGEFLRCNR